MGSINVPHLFDTQAEQRSLTQDPKAKLDWDKRKAALGPRESCTGTKAELHWDRCTGTKAKLHWDQGKTTLGQKQEKAAQRAHQWAA